jgi:hypothetical protein
MKDEIIIEYEQIEATEAEIETRLLRALGMLISCDDLYGIREEGDI